VSENEMLRRLIAEYKADGDLAEKHAREAEKEGNTYLSWLFSIVCDKSRQAARDLEEILDEGAFPERYNPPPPVGGYLRKVRAFAVTKSVPPEEID
jgi:hypothetical protein